ncbi:MAG: ABC transporter substrate-binding protein [Burkholderiaceae bacterium]|nr:ABC transporter substrate-binding protein [Burkholderiaceae bacterium]
MRFPHPRSHSRRAACLALLGSGAVLLSPAARAQQASTAAPRPTAPLLDGPLKIVVGYAPGGASDRAARLLADSLKDRLGVPVIVENKTGAGGRLSAQQVKAAGPDQNVLLAGNPAISVVAPLVAANVGYDPIRDFAPVSMLTRYDFAVAVGAAVPVREFTHLIAWLKANPDKANFGVPATGSLPHFFALMIGEAAGLKPQVIGYRGSAPLATDLLGGQIPVAVDTLDSLIPLHEAGKLRILAVGSGARLPEAPALPTLKESGLPLVADGWNALFAPSSMPAAKVQAIARAVEASMKEPALQAKFRANRMTPVAASQAQTVKLLADFRAKWEPVVKASGFRE